MIILLSSQKYSILENKGYNSSSEANMLMNSTLDRILSTTKPNFEDA